MMAEQGETKQPRGTDCPDCKGKGECDQVGEKTGWVTLPLTCPKCNGSGEQPRGFVDPLDAYQKAAKITARGRLRKVTNDG